MQGIVGVGLLVAFCVFPADILPSLYPASWHCHPYTHTPLYLIQVRVLIQRILLVVKKNIVAIECSHVYMLYVLLKVTGECLLIRILVFQHRNKLQKRSKRQKNLYIPYFIGIQFCCCYANSIHAGQGVHHHSFVTFFGVSFCLHEGVQQRFLHTDGCVGPNSGRH